MKHTRFLSIAISAMSVGMMSAQTITSEWTHREHNIPGTHGYFSRNDSAKAREILKKNAPDEFDIPGSQRFVVLGRDHKFYLSIGGYAKATASFDFGSPLDNPNEFITSSLAPKTPGNGGLVQFSAMQSHLCLNFVALPGDKNQVGFFIGTNFLDNYSPTLQFAYLKWRDLQAGYDYSIFSDPNAGPPTIDYEGPSACTAIPTTLVSYSGNLNKSGTLTGGIGVESPMYSVTGGDGAASVTQRIPDIPGYLQVAWGKDKSSWLRLSAVVRNMMYRNELEGKNHNVVGWGVQLSGSATILPKLTSYYEAVYGDGIASHIQDLNGLGMDMLPDPDNRGEMKAVKAWGGYAGLQYNFSDKVYCSGTYSHVRTYADRYAGGATHWGEQYKYAQYAVGNVFWSITDSFSTGLEYIYGRRVNFDGTQAHDNRLQCMFMLSF